MMPQFQIRRHPHGGTWQVFLLNQFGHQAAMTWFEGNFVQECIDMIDAYILVNCSPYRQEYFLEVLPD